MDSATRFRSASREAFLEDEPGRQVERRGPGDRQVVDGAVDGQVADVAAREEQRLDHVGVRGERHPGPVDRQLGRVLERLEERVAEGVEKDRLDQGLGRLAARPVRHRDAFFPDPRPAPPGAVDAVQDLLLPVGQRQLAPVPGPAASGRAASSCSCSACSCSACSRSASSIQPGWPWTPWRTCPAVTPSPRRPGCGSSGRSCSRRRRRPPGTPCRSRSGSPGCTRCRTPCIPRASARP